MKEIEPHDHWIFYQREEERDRAIEQQELEAEAAQIEVAYRKAFRKTNPETQKPKGQTTMKTKTKTPKEGAVASWERMLKTHPPVNLAAERDETWTDMSQQSEKQDKSAHTPTYAELLDALKDCHWQLGTFIESDAWEAADNDAYDKGAIVIAKAEGSAQ